MVRISDKSDRRINLVYLTKDGRALEETARPIANQTLMEALRGVKLEEVKLGQELLRKIFYNIKE